MLYSIGLPLLFVAAGLFTIICSLLNVSWFMSHRKALAMQKLLGNVLTRVFYIILGGVLLVMGVMFLIRGMPES